jgi:glycosyltransferase involved in cell wall biosynthesis
MSQPPEQSTLAVVIPCHNHADTLARAMRSALNQPELDELVVVIDAANDSSLAIAQSFEQDDSRVRVLGLVTQGGPAQARNIGAAAAASDILCFLDADDEHVSGYYRFIKETLASDPRWAGLKSGAQIVDLPDDLSCEDSDPRYSAALGSAPWNLAMRKPLFWLAGGFPVGDTFRGKLGGEDIALNRAFCKMFDVAFTPQKFCCHYIRPGSHLEQYLRRTTVVDGAILFTHALPEELDGSTAVAIDQHVARAAANRSLPSLGAGADAV